MRHRALTLAVAGAVVLVAGATNAHLKTIGGSLLDLFARADGVVVVRVVEPTRDAPQSYTRMRVHQPVAGRRPPADFVLRNALSPMRYATGQKAIVFFAADGDDLAAIQLAGEGLVFEGNGLDRETLEFLVALWRGTHAAEPGGDLGATLRAGLRLPHQKIRLLSALDIAELAHHQPGLSVSTRSALQKDLDDPDLDPAARVALSRALGTAP